MDHTVPLLTYMCMVQAQIVLVPLPYLGASHLGPFKIEEKLYFVSLKCCCCRRISFSSCYFCKFAVLRCVL